jgi:very-short-patch-repair endonuclease
LPLLARRGGCDTKKISRSFLSWSKGWLFTFMKKTHNLPEKKTLRQKLRHHATPAEKVLWQSLKNCGLGAKFRRQHGVGSYVLDFYCPKHKLAIEIEGSVHDDVLRSGYDEQRHAYLESQGSGYSILRTAHCWNYRTMYWA